MRKFFVFLGIFLLMAFSALARVEFNLSLSQAFVNPSDFNANARNLTELYKYIVSNPSPGVDLHMNGQLEELKKLIGITAEFRFFVTPNLAFGAGFNYQNRDKVSSFEYGWESSAHTYTVTFTEHKKVRISTPYMGLHLIAPVSYLTLDLYGNVGYLMGNFPDYNLHNVSTLDSSSNIYDYWITDVKKNTIGFWAGLRIDFNLNANVGILAFGEYRYAKFKDLKGTWRREVNGTVTDTRTGNLYYFESQYCTPNWYPGIYVDNTPPTSPQYRNVRKAEFDFSGFYAGIGFFLRF